MKRSNIFYLLFFFINVAVAFSCYFFPVTRDEFYYLTKVNTPNLFSEYYASYIGVNPRIGQFFSNAISRNIFVEILFGVLLFNAFISILFLNIYRRFPNFKKVEHLEQFLKIAAFFIFLLSYFGEMFYYTPFSTNYTMTHVFYLMFIFLYTEYYIYKNEDQLNKINYFLLVIFGLFIGMGNEHIPPVLLLMSFLGGANYLFKNRKLPNLRMIILPIFIFVGYLILFFAPANGIKKKDVGKPVLDIGLESYLSNFTRIFKFYFYYNTELIIAGIMIVLCFFIFRKKIKWGLFPKKEILIYISFLVLPFFILAVSPLFGMRLLFFSSTLIIIILYQLCIALNGFFKFKFLRETSGAMLVVFFILSIFLTLHAHQNYTFVSEEIKSEKLKSTDVVLRNHFNYYDPRFGNMLNRKILLDSGVDYIDHDPSHDNSIEKNLIQYYDLNTIKIK